MAATASTELLVPVRTHPQISPEVRQQLAQERKRLAADPSANHVAADLSINNRFVFRSKPGTHRVIAHYLPMPPEEATYNDDEKKYRYAKRVWDRIVARRAYPDLPPAKAVEKMTDRMNDLRDRLNDTRIIFTRVPRHIECFYATDDEVVAGYLRGLMEAKVGEFANVYEQSGRARLIVGDQAFPDTNLGRQLAHQYASQHGIDEIKLVKE